VIAPERNVEPVSQVNNRRNLARGRDHGRAKPLQLAGDANFSVGSGVMADSNLGDDGCRPQPRNDVVR
jgi:hypothetical protein